MKTQVACAVVLLLFLSGCLGGDKGGSTQAGQGAANTQRQAPESTGFSDTLSDITQAITSGASYRCTYSYRQEEASALVSGAKAKVGYTIEGTRHNYLSDGQFVYIWEEGGTQGLKFSLGDIQQTKTNPHEGNIDLRQMGNEARGVDCKATTVSDDDFLPPGNVVFQDFSRINEEIPQIQLQGGDECSVCDSMGSDYARRQCLAGCR